MIATHSLKMINARLKQSALCARILHEVPRGLICSQTVNMDREFWACPINAMNMKKAKEELKNCDSIVQPSSNREFFTTTAYELDKDMLYSIISEMPEIEDGNIKQLVLPSDNLRKDSYLNITPIPSLGLLHEVFERLRRTDVLHSKRVIQPNFSALANHGECLIEQGGTINSIRRGIIPVSQETWRGDFIEIKISAEDVNIDSGYVAIGWPSLTAIGGFVHTIERETGLTIEFALGMTRADWKKGTKVGTFSRKDKNVKTSRIFLTEEQTANCDIVLLLRSPHNNDKLYEYVSTKTFHKIAGGNIVKQEIRNVVNDSPCSTAYLSDASEKVDCYLDDTLDIALLLYANHAVEGYTLNQNGYAFLEEPCFRTNARMSQYKHVWAEPTFTLVSQGNLTENSWWRRYTTSAGIFWSN